MGDRVQRPVLWSRWEVRGLEQVVALDVRRGQVLCQFCQVAMELAEGSE